MGSSNLPSSSATTSAWWTLASSCPCCPGASATDLAIDIDRFTSIQFSNFFGEGFVSNIYIHCILEVSLLVFLGCSDIDQNNFILDANFGEMADPNRVAASLNERAGIVEHGLFLDLASDVIVAAEDDIRHLKRNDL